MKSYTIAKASGEPGWDAIEPLRADCVLWEPDCGVRTEQKLRYDDTALYVFQRAWGIGHSSGCSAPRSVPSTRTAAWNFSSLSRTTDVM